MLGPATEEAAALLKAGAEAEGRLARFTIETGGRQVVSEELVSGAVKAMPRTLDEVVSALSGSHVSTKVIFADVEECFEKVLLDPGTIKAQQARLQMDILETRWHTARQELTDVLTKNAQTVDKLGASEAKKQAQAQVARLNDLFNSRYGFTNFLSAMPYDKTPAEFRQLMKQELAKSTASLHILEEVTDWATSLPFLKQGTELEAGALAKGDELFKDLRKVGTESHVAPKPGSKPIPGESAGSAARQATALDELARFHGEGDVLYDDIVNIVDGRVATEVEKGGSAAASDPKFVDDVTNHVQGRMAETLALRQAQFVEEVWKPAVRTAEDLSTRLNAALAPGAPKWRVEIITEPTFATTLTGEGGELMDSGIWLVREAPESNVAMPVFGLEVKSGELRGSIQQQVLDRMRSQGGLVQLPGTSRTFKVTLPPKFEFEKALASTRTLTKERVLGQLADKAPLAERSLAPAERLYTFKVPMARTDIRAASRACVITRLKQLKRF